MKKFRKYLLLLLVAMAFSCVTQNKKTSTSYKKTNGFIGDMVVSANYVKAKLTDPNVLFVDVREPNTKKPKFIPNSIKVSWSELADMSKKLGEPGWGHILPKEKLSKKLSSLGFDMDKEVILYAAGKASFGEDGRILWELKAIGFKNVKIVDGGIDAIKLAGIQLVDNVKPREKTNLQIKNIDFTHIIDTAELTNNLDKYKLLDARENDEYGGVAKYGEAKGGHIKGAINIPFSSLFNEDGKLKANNKLQKMFTKNGFYPEDEIVTYCTGGIRSSYMYAVLEMLDYKKVKNYQGSYYNWSAVNPVE